MLVWRSSSLAQRQHRTAHSAVGRHSQDVAQPLVPPRPHSRQMVVRRSGGLLSILPPGDNNNNTIYLYSAISPELKFCSEALVTTLA